jgi:hypothetical protein
LIVYFEMSGNNSVSDDSYSDDDEEELDPRIQV